MKCIITHDFENEELNFVRTITVVDDHMIADNAEGDVKRIMEEMASNKYSKHEGLERIVGCGIELSDEAYAVITTMARATRFRTVEVVRAKGTSRATWDSSQDKWFIFSTAPDKTWGQVGELCGVYRVEHIVPILKAFDEASE